VGSGHISIKIYTTRFFKVNKGQITTTDNTNSTLTLRTTRAKRVYVCRNFHGTPLSLAIWHHIHSVSCQLSPDTSEHTPL